jgi:hypothetical protein
LEDSVADTFVSTLCTIPGTLEAIRGMARVLRSAGTLIFFEHPLSPDPQVQRWQRWSEPIPHCVFEWCRVTRDIPILTAQSGFQIEKIDAACLASFPKPWLYCWGTAGLQPRQRLPRLVCGQERRAEAADLSSYE